MSLSCLNLSNSFLFMLRIKSIFSSTNARLHPILALPNFLSSFLFLKWVWHAHAVPQGLCTHSFQCLTFSQLCLNWLCLIHQVSIELSPPSRSLSTEIPFITVYFLCSCLPAPTKASLSHLTGALLPAGGLWQEGLLCGSQRLTWGCRVSFSGSTFAWELEATNIIPSTVKPSTPTNSLKLNNSN